MAIELFGKTPRTLGTIHFIGIGGVGMSAIAEMLHNAGFSVQGSDRSHSANVRRLEAKGVKIYPVHVAQNIDKAFRIVISTSIQQNNPELVAAKERGIRIVHRSEVLAEILSAYKGVAVAGTHGKTTTTALIYEVLRAGGVDPTVINGGVINSIKSNAYSGAGSWCVAEADESDGSFIRLKPYVSVVTNMDPEHIDYYISMESIRENYRKFLKNTHMEGCLVMCADHPDVAALAQEFGGRKMLTYGIHKAAHITASHIRQQGAEILCDVNEGKVKHENIQMNLVGVHNVQNALAAVCVARIAGIPFEKVREAFANFKGVNHRFTPLGTVKGLSFVDDYAHHPVEIYANIRAAKQVYGGKVTAVFQPHRYSRLSAFMDDFARAMKNADEAIILPVYAAGEHPKEGVDNKTLAKKIKSAGLKKVVAVENEEEFLANLKKRRGKDQMLLCMGAGDISSWAKTAIEALKE